MLLLILVAGCLATCAAQTTSPTPFSTMVPVAPLTGSVQATSLQVDSPEYVAILQASVQSFGELNKTTIAPVLNKLHDLIVQKLHSDPGITLTVKNITKV